MIPKDAAVDCTINRAKNEGYRTKIFVSSQLFFLIRSFEINMTKLN